MNVTIRILGRSAVDQPLAELSAATIALAGERVVHTPSVPAGAEGDELVVRVEPTEGVVFALGSWLDPASRPGPTPRLDGNGVQVGTDPAPTPVVRHRKGVWGGAACDTAFYPRDSLILEPAGDPGIDLSPA